MVYKNLYNRLFFSLFFFLIYFISLNNKFILFIFGTLIYILIFYEIFKYFTKLFKIIILYLLTSYFCLILYFFVFFDYVVFNIFVFTIIIFDSLSFITGKLIGKNYIFKVISPKKTLEGYVGGFITTNVFFFFYYYFMIIQIEINFLIILVNLIILISIIGDLIESYFKRKNNLKDSSNYLPGHGGYFDRFDSFVASTIMLTLLSLFLNL